MVFHPESCFFSCSMSQGLFQVNWLLGWSHWAIICSITLLYIGEWELLVLSFLLGIENLGLHWFRLDLHYSKQRAFVESWSLESDGTISEVMVRDSVFILIFLIKNWYMWRRITYKDNKCLWDVAILKGFWGKETELRVAYTIVFSIVG